MNKFIVRLRAKHGPHLVSFEIPNDEIIEMCKVALEKAYSLKIEDSSRIFYEVIPNENWSPE